MKTSEWDEWITSKWFLDENEWMRWMNEFTSEWFLDEDESVDEMNLSSNENGWMNSEFHFQKDSCLPKWNRMKTNQYKAGTLEGQVQ
jgi:hypothetical protein